MSWKSAFPGQIMNKTEFDHYINIGGINYHYREIPGGKEKIVLLHGFASSTYTWEQIDRRLSKLGYHVFSLDMKGFGWSDKPRGADYSPDTLMEDVRAWMEALNLKDVTFAGNSLGGGIACLMAFSYPKLVKRLVLIDAGGHRMKLPNILRLFKLPFAHEVGKVFFGRWIVRLILREVYFHGNWITDEQVEAYYQRMSTFNAVGSQISFARTINFDLYEIYMKRLREIRQKALIIWGERDSWIPLEHGYLFQRDLPDAELAVIPECGHIPQEEKPEVVLRLIHDFIRGKDLRRGAGAGLGVIFPGELN
jgi:pimeloyl-ACP methyl ester carboxylesterase